jgi:hypothetical protein
MTPHGYTNFNSYIENLPFLLSGHTDRVTEPLFRGGLGNLTGSSRLL